MYLNLVKPWRHRKVGTRIMLADGAANVLIRRKIATEVVETADQPERPLSTRVVQRKRQQRKQEA